MNKLYPATGGLGQFGEVPNKLRNWKRLVKPEDPTFRTTKVSDVLFTRELPEGDSARHGLGFGDTVSLSIVDAHALQHRDNFGIFRELGDGLFAG